VNTEVTINNQAVFYYETQFSLLDSMEENAVPVSYNCRGGYCGQCKMQLKQGKVHWIQDSLVPLQDDEILACCCVPNGPISLLVK
jgi:ferredoxin